MEKAFYEAKNGRCGPVWIDIPLDVQSKKITLSKLKSFKAPKNKLNLKKVNKDVDDILKLFVEDQMHR